MIWITTSTTDFRPYYFFLSLLDFIFCRRPVEKDPENKIEKKLETKRIQ